MNQYIVKGRVVTASSKKEATSKVTAFYDFFEMEPKLKKLQTNIQYFLQAVNSTLKYLDSKKAWYQTESDFNGNKAEYLITITNKNQEDKTFSISLEGNFEGTKFSYKEKVGNEYKQFHKPLLTEIKKFLGEL